MSADYWGSSQRAKWQFTKEKLHSYRLNIFQWEKQKLSTNPFYLRHDTNARIYIHQLISKLGRRLAMRQIVVATAEVYVSRFLTRVSLFEINIYMLVTAAIYLAGKVCECPQHIRTVLSEARNSWPEYVCADFTKLAELEYYLIDELECYLIIHCPYNSLNQLVNVLGRENKPSDIDKYDENGIRCHVNLTDQEIENTWHIINDSFITDLPLLYPPHVIAIAALHIVLVLRTETFDIQKGHAKMSSDSSLHIALDNTGQLTRNNWGNSPTKPKSKSSKVHLINTDKVIPGDVTSLQDDIDVLSPSTNVAAGLISSNNFSLKSNIKGSLPHNNQYMNVPQLQYQGGLRRKLSQSINSGQTRQHKNVVTTTMGVSTGKHNDTPDIYQNTRIEAFTNFLAGSNVNLEEIIDSVQQLLTLYETWQDYDESAVRQNFRILLMSVHTSSLKNGMLG